jgi:glutamate carboxypeptidase
MSSRSPTLSSEVASDLNAAAGSLLTLGRVRLAEYVAAESPTGDGPALDAFAEMLAAHHRRLGGSVEVLANPTGAHVVSTWGDPGPGFLCLVGHSDTVWPRGTLVGMPFSDDGAVARGPGVYDMKAGLVAVELALRALLATGTTPAQGIRLLVVADEEIGSPTGSALVRRAAEHAVGVLGLEPPHADGALKTGRRGSTRLALRVTGREAHAAVDPEAGVSAIDELLDQLAALRRLVADEGTTLLNIGRLEGGERANVIAGRAAAEIGLRFTDPDAEARVLGALTALTPRRTGAAVEAVILSNRPAWVAPDRNPLLETVRAVGRLLGQDITGRPAPGAGDTNLTGSAGVPTLDGFGALGQGAHARHEQIAVPSLAERAALLAAVLTTPLPGRPGTGGTG